VWRGLLRHHFDPLGAPKLFGAGKTTASHRYFVMDLRFGRGQSVARN
jgi:hypothetical protein